MGEAPQQALAYLATPREEQPEESSAFGHAARFPSQEALER